MWALSTASSSVAAPGRTTVPAGRQRRHQLEVDLLVVERHDVAALGEGPQVVGDEGRPDHDLGRDVAGGVVRPFGQHRHGEAECAGGFARHARQLARPDEPDVMGAQSARLHAGDSPRQWAGHSGQTTRGSTTDMPRPLRIGSMLDIGRPLPDTVAQLQRYADAGLDHAFVAQIFGPDALTLLATAGAQVPGIGIGHRRRPGLPPPPDDAGAAGAHGAVGHGDRLLLGIGLSHQVVVESIWGLSFERPAQYMKEYLASLLPLLRGEAVSERRGAGDHERLCAARHRRRRAAAGAGRRPGAAPCCAWPAPSPTARSPG